MLERRRKSRGYHLAPGAAVADRDVELGRFQSQASNTQAKKTETIEQELDNWDENVEDEWDETEDPDLQNSHGDKQEPRAAKSEITTKKNKERKE